MSALQEILDKMYVDPELLEHLQEEQKMLLFIKMREEQVRRWRLNEERFAREEAQNGAGDSTQRRRLPSDKRVQWKTGRDGDVWVWVMGEHSDDLTIEEILEKETKEKEAARQIAMKEKQERLRREIEAEEQQQRELKAWEEQEKKAREAEAQIRLIARKAREEHLKMRTSAALLPALRDTSSRTLKDAIKNLPRPPKPESRAAIVQWYRDYERPKGTGIDPETGKPAVWFHGIISRTHAEELLAQAEPGAYLVRVSERIWGYTVSYAAGDLGATKHFLVEKIPEGYQFLGTNQIVHSTLYDLVRYHQTYNITAKGNEILRHPIGQRSAANPDYNDLLV